MQTRNLSSVAGHEMREGCSFVKNYVVTLERPAITGQEKRDAIRSARLQPSSVNTLDNILRLAKNDSGLSKIDVKNIPLKRLMDGLRFQFERPNQAFPVSVRFLQDDGLIEAASVALDVNVIEWSVESLLLNSKNMRSHPRVLCRRAEFG